MLQTIATHADPAAEVLARLTSFRQHQQNGHRSPHKPLLVLLTLGRLANSGSSALPWSAAENALADLIAEFGHPSRTGRAQSAAYPFTRLRSDGVWVLDADVEMDRVGPLARHNVAGSLEPGLEAALRAERSLIMQAARMLVTGNFPDTVAPDVLQAVGLDPHEVLSAGAAVADPPIPLSSVAATRAGAPGLGQRVSFENFGLYKTELIKPRRPWRGGRCPGRRRGTGCDMSRSWLARGAMTMHWNCLAL